MRNPASKSCLRSCCAGVALVALWAGPAVAGSPRPGSGLHVVARYEVPLGSTPEREAHWTAKGGEKRVKVPQGVAPAFDIRWASIDSVYVARADDGVWELALEPGLPVRRQLVPDTRTLGRFSGYEHLAASSTHLAFASSSWYLAWRPLAGKETGTVQFDRREIGVTTDLDLQGDRLLLLGRPSAPEGGDWAGQEGIAWLGSLDKHLEDFTPVLADASGVASTHLWKCGTLAIGAVRFLADGSFIVVPGFQPGATLFDAGGHPIRVWSGPETGLDTDCGAEETVVQGDPSSRLEWLNRHRVLEDVLPLAEGPALLIRFLGQDKRIHWELQILGAQSSRLVEVPLSSAGPTSHLRGDVRNGRIVFLLSQYFPLMDSSKAGEIVVAELNP